MGTAPLMKAGIAPNAKPTPRPILITLDAEALPG
jgi:hypothetical protein